ncbi:MAG: geranylgeranylglycerol-phosphate geranylgeranyltransferase [bacterium]
MKATQKIFSIISITRPVNFLITFFSITVAGIICSVGDFKIRNILLAAVAGAFIGSGGNIINDIYDIDIDRINRPQRILPSNKMTITEAWLSYFSFTVIALVLTVFINFPSFAIAVFSSIVIFFYSKSLKKIPLFGNVTVAFFTGLAFIFGGMAVDNWTYAIIPAVFAFFINFIREIVKDIEDIEGDRANGVITFPQKFGERNAAKLISVFTILLIAITVFPFLLNIYSIEYFIIVMLTVNVLLVYFLKRLFMKDVNYRSIGNLLKLIMIFGLIAIYAGSKQ